MTNSLEMIDSDLFQPLAVDQAALLVGGAAGAGFTYVGLTEHDGNLYHDHKTDPKGTIAPDSGVSPASVGFAPEG